MTARDAIATILCNAAGKECGCDGRACGQIADGLMADEAVRLELAGKLCPDLLYPADKPLPAPPPGEQAEMSSPALRDAGIETGENT